MLAAAKKRLEGLKNVEFVAGELTDLPLKDASVDVAVCMLVLHHVENQLEALAEMRRIVRPGGVGLIVDMVEHDAPSIATPWATAGWVLGAADRQLHDQRRVR